MSDPRHEYDLDWYFNVYPSEVSQKAQDPLSSGSGAADEDRIARAHVKARPISAALARLDRVHIRAIAYAYEARQWPTSKAGGVEAHLKGIYLYMCKGDPLERRKRAIKKFDAAHDAYATQRETLEVEDRRKRREFINRERRRKEAGYVLVDVRDREEFGLPKFDHTMKAIRGPNVGWVWAINDAYEAAGAVAHGLRVLHGDIRPRYKSLAEWSDGLNAAEWLDCLGALHCRG